jgi:hypothetical protein
LANGWGNASESRDLGHLAFGQEPIRDPSLIEHLDRARVQTACARAPGVLVRAPLDDGNVNAR